MAARRKVGRSGGGKKKAAGKPAARASKPAPKKAVVKAKAVKAKARAARPALKPRHAPETLRVRSIMPSMTANDFPRSLAFYTETLGFVVTDSWKDEAGVVRGARRRSPAPSGSTTRRCSRACGRGASLARASQPAAREVVVCLAAPCSSRSVGSSSP